MLLRILWPSVADLYHHDCLLLGAVFRSVQKSQQVTTAVIVALCPLEALQQSPQLLQQLSACSVPIPTERAQAQLAVLGTWQQHHQQQQLQPAFPAPQGPDSVWLAFHGTQCLQETLASSRWSSTEQQLSVPCCSLGSCTLPEATDRVQLFVYSVPAQLPGCAGVQLPVPAAGPQLPWMVREAGAVSLSAVMHMLQQAHAAVQQQQQVQQQLVGTQPRAQQQQGTAAKQQAAVRPRTRASSRQSQQQPQQQQQQHSLHGQTERQGWVALTALLAAANSSKPTAWLARQQAVLTAQLTSALQQLAARSPAAWAAAAHGNTPAAPSGSAAAAAAGGGTGSAAAAAAGGGTGSAAAAAAGAATAAASEGTKAGSDCRAGGQGSSGSSQQLLGPSGPGLLQVLVQHLLGVLLALNLLLHSAVVLDAAAAAGSWLQQDVLQPHIHWLMQGHPGGIKLHLELSLLMGTAADTYLATASAMYSWSWHWLGPAALLAAGAAAAAGGASVGCVAVADVLPVLLWPLVLAYVLCAGLHRLQLRCLTATWRLIRGKQKVRRFRIGSSGQQQQPPVGSQQGPPAADAPQAQDTSPATAATAAATAAAATAAAAAGSPEAQEPSDEVSVEQLIVGVLLFTPLLGLLPTTAAWYLSATGLYGMLHCLRLLLVAVGSWMQLRPLHVLAARWRQPQMFPGQLMVLPLQTAGATAAQRVGPDATAAAAARPAVQDADRPTTTTSSKKCSGTRSGRGSRGSDAVSVSYYRVFYEPLGYWEVLTRSIAQQQGLLWHVCFGCDSRAGASTLGGGVSWALQWLKDFAAGRVWGLRSLSVR